MGPNLQALQGHSDMTPPLGLRTGSHDLGLRTGSHDLGHYRFFHILASLPASTIAILAKVATLGCVDLTLSQID